jgi:hypothetical protein
MLIMIPFVPFWWVSGILYAISILVSVRGLMIAESKPSNFALENELLKLDDLLERGVISRNEYERSRNKILGLD